MTAEQLQAYLQSEKSLTLQKVHSIIYECKNDIAGIGTGLDVRANQYTAGYYAGESNAFYLCLDLLDKVEDRLDAAGLRRRFDVLADALGLERGADPREILDKVIEIHKGKQQRDREALEKRIMSLIPETIDTDAGTHIHLLCQERLKIAKAVTDGLEHDKESKDIVDNIFGELESTMRVVKYPRTLPNGQVRVETIRGYMIMHDDYEAIKKKYRAMIRGESDGTNNP